MSVMGNVGRGKSRVVLAEHPVDQLAQPTGHLHTGRPATDDDDPEIDGRIAGRARPFELGQQM
jgi:hypothetical protein